MHFKDKIMCGYMKKFTNKSAFKKLYKRFYSLDFVNGIFLIKNNQDESNKEAKVIKFASI